MSETAGIPKPLDIGIATSLSGRAAPLGLHIKNGIIMAMDDQNEQGGVTIAGQKYILNPIIGDTKSNPVDARLSLSVSLVELPEGSSRVDYSGD